jgi:Sodium/hydrogen exchanger family
MGFDSPGKIRMGNGVSLSASSSPPSSDAVNNDYIDVHSQDESSSSSSQPATTDNKTSRTRREAMISSLLQKTAESSRRMTAHIQGWMKKVLLWQQTKGRSLVAAAVLSLSVLVLSNQAISNHFDSVRQQSATEVHRRAATKSQAHSRFSSPFQQKEMLAASSRGGGGGGGTGTSWAKSSSSSISFHKKSSSLAHSMEEGMATASVATQRTIRDAMIDLSNYMRGPKSDTLLLLLATALITPICKIIKISPILGFLASGMLLGPNGFGLISGIHTTETLAELGIVFFLFEMGIELSFERLLSMRKDVFGLGLCQFIVTGLAVAAAGAVFGGLPANALIVLGGGLALSSSAFVLQLLKDKNQLATRFGKASFGILLFQDLAVVPLLVVTPILAGAGSGLASAVGAAVLKAGIALGSIAVAGRFVLNPLFKTVAQAQSQEAFLGVILLTVLSMSFMTEGLGLSNTLGAFLAGVLLSETKYRYQVEADIAPFRGILLGK